MYSSLHHRTRSSAYMAPWTFFGIFSMMSLKVRKSVGDNTSPCGMPCFKVRFLLWWSLICVLALLFVWVLADPFLHSSCNSTLVHFQLQAILPDFVRGLFVVYPYSKCVLLVLWMAWDQHQWQGWESFRIDTEFRIAKFVVVAGLTYLSSPSLRSSCVSEFRSVFLLVPYWLASGLISQCETKTFFSWIGMELITDEAEARKVDNGLKKNKWRNEWMDKKDEWIVHSDNGCVKREVGAAWCSVCGGKLVYKSNGKKSIKVHSMETKHVERLNAQKHTSTLPAATPVIAPVSKVDCLTDTKIRTCGRTLLAAFISSRSYRFLIVYRFLEGYILRTEHLLCCICACSVVVIQIVLITCHVRNL